MLDERLAEETTRAFVDFYDEMLDSMGIPRLTQDQRDVLLGFLDASAEDEPLLIKALQETRESWKWISGTLCVQARKAK